MVPGATARSGCRVTGRPPDPPRDDPIGDFGRSGQQPVGQLANQGQHGRFTGQIGHPEVQHTIDEIVAQGRAAGKAVGVGGNSDAEGVRRNILRGATYLTLSYAGFIGRASRTLLTRAREA